MSDERRRFNRLPSDLHVRLNYSGESHACRTRDLGMGGMSLDTPLVLDFGTHVDFEIELPTTGMTVRGEGEVRWGRASGTESTGLGVAFGALKPIDVWYLIQHFKALEEQTGEPLVKQFTGG
ncbi:MAG: PilZ domain-containing protein [Bradymonadia bacterium]